MVEPRLSFPLIRNPARGSTMRHKPQVPAVLARIPTRIRAPPLVVDRLSSAQRLRRDKTFLSASTAIGKALDQLDEDFLPVTDADISDVIDRTNTFIYSITHRINKNRHNLKFSEPYINGPAVNGLFNKHNYSHLNLYFPLKFKDFRLKSTHEGYTCIHMNRNPSFDRFQSIRSDGHRNFVSPLKISVAIHELMTHICQSLGRGIVLPLQSNNSDYGEGTHQIVIILDECIRLTIVPALQPRVLRKDEDGTILVSKPYYFDKDPVSDTLWRYDNPSKAKKLLDTMKNADREIRSKAVRLLHISSTFDPVLRLCPQEFITMVLYEMFDEDVDLLPCWQTVDLESCFISILTHWHHHMISGSLPHPFTAGLNTLGSMAEKNRLLVRNRITRLLSNRRELLRLIKLRPTTSSLSLSQSPHWETTQLLPLMSHNAV